MSSEIEELTEKINNVSITISKGNGAGGKNTNLLGKTFEEKTLNEDNLISKGFERVNVTKTKYGYFLHKNFEDREVIYITQTGFKIYMKKYYDIDFFRCPDEAYIVKYKDEKQKIKLLILEKKEQCKEGSVETKLWAGPSLKREYELVLNSSEKYNEKFIVEYNFCVSNYLKEKILNDTQKYKILCQILTESNIKFLYGDDTEYFDELNKWIFS